MKKKNERKTTVSWCKLKTINLAPCDGWNAINTKCLFYNGKHTHTIQVSRVSFLFLLQSNGLFSRSFHRIDCVLFASNYFLIAGEAQIIERCESKIKIKKKWIFCLWNLLPLFCCFFLFLFLPVSWSVQVRSVSIA